ncbi:MAG: Ig-like domain-containing protein [Opitutaceae bacterium]|nr:Ig-like domain-containing protein [Opitutaceae bacterium]
MKTVPSLIWVMAATVLTLPLNSVGGEGESRTLIRHAPTLNGRVEGSVQVLTAEAVVLNGNAVVTGDLLVPGTPTVRLNGHPIYGGTQDGLGAAAPAGYPITLNGTCSLRHVIRRTDPVTLPVVDPPPAPSGTRNVTLSNASQSPGDFTTIRHLTLNGNVGPIAVPPGTYGDFTANGHSSFTLGVAGATQPARYAFQRLTLNGNTALHVAGPVIVTLARGMVLNGHTGAAANPGWLTLQLASGGLTLNGRVALYGYVTAPGGIVVINGSSQLIGGLVCDRLTLNGNSLLRLITANQPPQVALTTPTAGTTWAAYTAVTLVATATDADSTITQVEFFDGATSLGLGTPVAGQPGTFTFTFTFTQAGAHTLLARATDDGGATTDSAPVPVSVLASLPYTADFEASEGYTAGPLNEQLGWNVDQGDAGVTAEAAFSGAHSVVLSPGTPLAKIAQTFAPLAGQEIVFVDFFAKPVADADLSAATTFEVESSRTVLVRTGPGGELWAFNGDGQGGGQWQATGFVAPLGRDGQAQHWIRLTLRLDFVHQTWDLSANGALVAADLAFRDRTRTALTAFAVQGHAAAATRLDYLCAATENPLFADADQDGLDDAWESAHGLDPAVNDRDGDLDGDGLSNLREWLLGTQPNLADSDGDALPDGWEITYQLDPLQAATADADADHDGLSDLQEYAAGTNPNQMDTDGDGFMDGVEVALGINPLQPEPASHLDSDADGDSLTLAQELQLGTDPNTAEAGETADLDGDGLPNAWELAHGTDPRVGEQLDYLNADADGDGLSAAQEAQAGTNPEQTDTDGDGLPDDYEVHAGLDPLAADQSLDPDGDGLSNAEEHQRGTDPKDYYNGVVPELVPLFDDAELGPNGLLAVRVMTRDGTSLINAPVTLEITDGDKMIALTPDGLAAGRSAQVRTGPDGIARAYVRAP